MSLNLVCKFIYKQKGRHDKYLLHHIDLGSLILRYSNMLQY